MPTLLKPKPISKWADLSFLISMVGKGLLGLGQMGVRCGLNLGLVLALLAGLRWAYPVSLLALGGFIAYQLNKFAHTGDMMMIILSVIDIFVIWLIWREWKAHLRTT